MTPAFEELFDQVEQHVLNILLEPWTRLVTQDRESLHEVTPRPTNEGNSALQLSESSVCCSNLLANRDQYFHGVCMCMPA